MSLNAAKITKMAEAFYFNQLKQVSELTKEKGTTGGNVTHQPVWFHQPINVDMLSIETNQSVNVGGPNIRVFHTYAREKISLISPSL